MNLIKFKIFPKSPFASQPKGDMIFGMFAKFLFEVKKDTKLNNYLNNPNIIFSDFLPTDYLPKPALPPKIFEVDEDSKNKKDFKNKNFLKLNNISNILNKDSFEYVGFLIKDQFSQVQISRSSGVHENGQMFSVSTSSYIKNLELYVAFNENDFTETEISDYLKIIGIFGFGSKSSSGFGQFDIELVKTDITNWRIFGKSINNGINEQQPSFLQGVTIGLEIKLNSNIISSINNQTGFLTLSPSIPNNGDEVFYNLYTKFGKYGSNRNQFYKQHSLMADSGAVYLK